MILGAQDCGCPAPYDSASMLDSTVCSPLLFMIMLEGYIRGRCNITTPCSRIRSVDNVEEEYDFIVVGAGSAGSIAAARLSENRKYSVLLLEAGGDEPIQARMPSYYRTFWFSDKIDWRYRTVPDNYCLDQDDQGCMWPRGKVLGGSSVLNGMMYHRGHAADYEDWVKAGAEGWSWEENKPYFDMTEGNKQIGNTYSNKYHSCKGELPVQQFRYQPPAVQYLLDAVNETGLPVIADMNDPNTPEGFTVAQAFNDDGQRYTTARAFLKPKTERPNLSLKLNAHVSKVLIKNKRAVGVEYIDQNGVKNIVRAKKEVILSAGALNTPHILLLSGIGPRETLEKFDIPVVEDLPVGLNLRNHYGITLYFILTKIPDVQTLDWSVASEYLLEGTGPMSGTGVTQVTGLLYSSLADRSLKQPDLQFFFNGFYAECSATGMVGEMAGDVGKNVSANGALLLPRSIGYLTLNSSDPLDPPLFYPGYFSHPDDITMIRDAARYLQRIFESHTLHKTYGLKLDTTTTARCSKNVEWSDEWIECMARLHTDPQNHQLGTAAIGKVVDTELKVYNISGLRVIDASAMPTQVTGNPQGAIMLVAERGAASIKNEWK